MILRVGSMVTRLGRSKWSLRAGRLRVFRRIQSVWENLPINLDSNDIGEMRPCRDVQHVELVATQWAAYLGLLGPAKMGIPTPKKFFV